MKPRNTLAMALLLALGLGVVVYSARIASYYRATVVELGRVKLSQVEPALERRLQGLSEEVLATYYVSPRAEMPSHLRRLERRVTDLLEALKAASAGNFDYQILDPHQAAAEDSAPNDGQAQSNEKARYAARQGIAPFRVRSVTRDAWSEKTIWSTLTIAYGAYPPAIINGLSLEHLPRLAATIEAHIDQMEEPRRPVIALSAPDGFEQLREELALSARVVRFDLASQAIPEQADVLYWVQPGTVDAAVLRELDRFLASGRSAVVAGSLQRVRAGVLTSDGEFQPEVFEAQPSGYDAETLLGHFGLRPTPGLVCDERSMIYRQGEGESEVTTAIPFLVRCIAPNQRFGLVLKGQPNGTLLFEAPTPFQVDPEALTDRGWTPEVLAHTSDKTWIEPLPDGVGDARRLAPERGVSVSRQPLVLMLRPADPWRGSVVLLASDSPLRDDLIRAEGFAHRRLVDVLTSNLASDERLVLNRTQAILPQSLPELGTGERTLWRAATVLLVPALLCVLALARGVLRARRGRAAAATPGRARLALAVAAVFALGLVGMRFAALIPLRADWTASGLNRLAPATERLARAARGDAALRAELFLSRREKLPPAMRRAAARLEDLLSDLERAGAQIELRRIRPGDLDPDERDRLRTEGIAPVRVTSREEGVTTVRTVYSVLRLSRGAGDSQRTELIALPDASAFEGLEFRMAFALWRLETGRAPRIAFASDTPRLSPAEAHMDYQLRGLFAPIGDDPYSAARDRLREVGFEVLHVNPRDPRFPAELDALVCLQPRRDASAMIDAMARYLHQGGRVLLCAQHFNLQARQYRGTNFETVYWPQPQSPDLDRYWLPELGIELVREVLFDELKARLSLETQVNRDAARRDYEEQASALPFLIRAAAANFADDPITRGVGDLLFVAGNRLEWQPQRLAELGLEAVPLVTSSERAWAYAWSGGYLPAEVLAGFPREDTETVTRLGRRPLAARFRGSFPLPVEPIVELEQGEPAPDRGLPSAPAAPGELVLVGSSEMFKNDLLVGSEFRADYLLVNAVADLVLPADLARVAGRRRVARGFDFLSGEQKGRWRAFVVAVGPLAIVGLGVLRALLRRRAPRLEIRDGRGAA